MLNVLMIKFESFSKIYLKNVFLSYRKNFLKTQKRIRTSHGKRVIGVVSGGGGLKIYCSFIYIKDNRV